MEARQCKQSTNRLLLRLDKGEEIMRSLTIFLRQNNIMSGSITGIGNLSDVTVKYFHPDRKEYSEYTFPGSYECLSLMGNISTVENQIFPHVHVVLADEQFRACGGHLSSATVSVTLEIVIIPLEGEVEREFNEEIGLHHLKLHRPTRVIQKEKKIGEE